MELDKDLIKKVCDIVEVDYTGELNKEEIEEMIRDLLRKISDIEYEVEELKDEIIRIENKDSFDYYDYYGVSPNDFH